MRGAKESEREWKDVEEKKRRTTVQIFAIGAYLQYSFYYCRSITHAIPSLTHTSFPSIHEHCQYEAPVFQQPFPVILSILPPSPVVLSARSRRVVCRDEGDDSEYRGMTDDQGLFHRHILENKVECAKCQVRIIIVVIVLLATAYY